VTSNSTLELECERKISALLPESPDTRAWEASGVLARNGKYFVVFDNQTSIARLSADLDVTNMNGLFGTAHAEEGYEGIAYNAAKHRYYLLVESRRRKTGEFHAEIVEYDDTLSYVKSRPVDFAFKTGNKGFEAVAHMRRKGQDYVLALCEGNRCKSGRKGRTPGDGRVQLFEKTKKRWSHVNVIELPKSVLFRDYSAMAIDGNRIAIVSQENSMLWTGVFEAAEWSWRDDGRTYEFPRSAAGDVEYGNVEGVDWISSNRIVTVSDRRKKGNQPLHFADKDQSLHIFELPD